jgi:hypothetical protein
MLGWRQRFGIEINLWLHDSELSFDLSITIGDLLIVEIVHFHHLAQGEEILWLVVAMQRFSDFFFTPGALTMTELSQFMWIALTSQDGSDDGHPSKAGDVTEYIGQF